MLSAVAGSYTCVLHYLKASFSLAPYSFSHLLLSGRSELKVGSSLNMFVVQVEEATCDRANIVDRNMANI